MKMTSGVRALPGRRMVCAILASGLLVAACGGDEGSSTSETTGAPGASETASTDATSGVTDAPADTEPESTDVDGTGASSDTTPGSGAPSVEIDTSVVMRIGTNLTANGGSSPDPGKYTGNPDSGLFLNAMYDTLVYYEEGTQTLMPGLAESWETPDEHTLIFHLRPNVTFHDGTPLNAEAVVYSWERSARMGALLSAVFDHELLEATDELTVTIKFVEPVVGFYLKQTAVEPWARAIVSPTAAENEGDDGFENNPVGAGPYRFESWRKDQEFKLVPYEGYWNPDAQHFAGWEVYNVPFGQARLTALQSGQVNLTQIGTFDIGAAEASGFEVTRGVQHLAYPSVISIGTCPTSGPFSSVDSRRAIGYAVDRDAINDGAYGSGSDTTIGLTQPSQSDYSPDAQPDYTYDPAKAEELLVSSGAAGASVTLMVNANSSEISLAAQIIQEQLQDVGLNVEIVESTNFIADLAASPPELYLTRMPLASLGSYYSPHEADGVLNPCNAGTDALRQAISDARSGDDALANEAWAIIEQENTDGAFYIPLVTAPSWFAHQKGMHVDRKPNFYSTYVVAN